ncbi:preprotein translocase subunit SecG [Pigmentiphaga aceris]|uniref:Protein-export membrane protein SecG n=1 Tax=Pigmentiphaga aceris TaxID=1940612 RepID=A0A5C0ATN8_9BURK|nr:preprotein translocase subunit SecG [Pigmentiphaga aceris]QEI05702.1 preprotein translocase subunit SecG [Pigmentiphaga aceris]
MSMLFTVLLVVQVISALSIIVLVLLQQGKGADMGSAFGGGSAGSLFGATGAANFLSRSTKWAAVVFFVTTASLAYVGTRPLGATAPGGGGVMENVPADRSVPSVPGQPAASGSTSSVPSVPATPAPAQNSGAVPATPAK